jgi:4-oxalocrotonate tautomerase
MPIIQIHLIEGRSREKTEQLIAEVTRCVATVLDAPEQSVRVILNEVPREHFGIAGKSVAQRLEESKNTEASNQDASIPPSPPYS